VIKEVESACCLIHVRKTQAGGDYWNGVQEPMLWSEGVDTGSDGWVGKNRPSC